MSKPIAVFEKQLTDVQEKWEASLPPNIDPMRFKSSVMTAVMRNQDLLNADRQSLILACMQSAGSGILPDGKEGAIVLFKDRKNNKIMAQWMPMVSGVIRRLRELGDLTSISAYNVYKGDKFEVILGDNPQIIHVPDMMGSRKADDIIAAYAIFKNGNEVVHREIMTLEEIDKTRAVSKARDGGAWRDWFGEMSRKTVIRRGAKSVPLSSAGAEIIAMDDQWVDFKGSKAEVTENPLENKPEELPDPKNEIEDAVIIEDEDTEQEKQSESKAPRSDPAGAVEKALSVIERIDDAEELEQFHDRYSDKIKALPAPDRGRVNSAYRSKLKELRRAVDSNEENDD